MITCKTRYISCLRSEAVDAHLNERVQRLEAFKFVSPNVKAEICFYPKNQSYVVSLVAGVVKKNNIKCEATSENVSTAINQAVDKILDQLRRVKTQFEK